MISFKIGVIALLCPLIQCRIICNVETYVLSGLEFAKCNQAGMDAFPVTPLNINPCPILDHLINSCAEILKPCYDQRGWVRNRQAFLELLAAQYPANNECDVFDKGTNDNAEHPQQLPGEKCSINQEVELMMDMRTCSTNAQSKVLTELIGKSTANQTLEIAEIVCNGLDEISDKCYVEKLPTCYDDNDAKFHLAFLLEELRLAGITFVSHLTPMNGSNEIMDVDECRVFRNGPLAIFQSHEAMTQSRYSNKTVILLAVLLTIATLIALSFVTFVAVTKTRLGPILRARFQNTPYTDFSAEQSGDQESSQSASARPKPSSQTMSMVVQNEANSSLEESPGA